MFRLIETDALDLVETDENENENIIIKTNIKVYKPYNNTIQ